MKLQTLVVENIKCGGCANSIRTKLNAIEGVSDTNVEIAEGKITFQAIDEISIADAENTLQKMGYPKTGDNDLGAKAKSFVSCMVGRIT